MNKYSLTALCSIFFGEKWSFAITDRGMVKEYQARDGIKKGRAIS